MFVQNRQASAWNFWIQRPGKRIGGSWGRSGSGGCRPRFHKTLSGEGEALRPSRSAAKIHRMADDVLAQDPLWYKDAIIYELHVKTFHDSNGDGIGDFRGLIEKLDYLQELGVTAIWLLPFYPVAAAR